MVRYRSILALLLAFLTAFLVSCATPAQVQPPVYSPTQVEQIQAFVSKIGAVRARMQELATSIQNRKWSDVESFIHGPLGELRSDLVRTAANLPPNVQDQARKAAKGLFGHLIEIDRAAGASDYSQAIRNYAEAIKDFDTFLQLVPNE